LYGLGGNDEIYGLAGEDLLDGGTGGNSLYGGQGNDLYHVRTVNTNVYELSDEGTDSIVSWVSYALPGHVEGLYLENVSEAVTATGNALNNDLVGNSYNNILDGREGSDRMIGGLGDDIYIVDHAGDLITEHIGEGTDTVISSVSYTLSANVENLTLSGGGSINATGNALNNTLTGNAANNTLDGGTGADTMIGGQGNDTYSVDHVGDTITENSGEGTDTVTSSVSYTLSANVENLTLIGSDAVNATGNSLSNILVGNAANNTLDGKAGDDVITGYGGGDILIGGFGNDSLSVEGEGNVLTGGAGVDTFTFRDINFTANNRITDFELGDLIYFGNSIRGINSLAEGSGASVVAGQVQYRISNGDTLLYVGTDDSSGADAIVTLTGFTNPQSLRVVSGLIGSFFNAAPTSSNKSHTIPEARSQIVWARDFAFFDANSGDTLAFVKVTGLSNASGQYRLNNQALAVNDVISVADIEAGRLTYTSPAFSAANPVSIMSFAVSDGVDYSGSYSLSFAIEPVVQPPPAPPVTSISTTTTTVNTVTTTTTVTFAATFAAQVSEIKSIGLSPDGQYLLIRTGTDLQKVAVGSTMSFNGSTVTTSELTQSITSIPVFQSNGGVGGFTLPELFTGPASLGLKYQLIETADNAVVIGSSDNDFIKVASANSIGKAVNGGGGNDVIDGGVGSTFVTGGGTGTNSSTYFLDGRAPGTSWSTITDFKLGSDKATVWGFVRGVSSVDASFTNFNDAGAPSYEGLTLHFKNLLPSGQTSGSNASLNSITLSGRSLQEFGASSLAELNAQLTSGINSHFVVGSVSDLYGEHGYLHIS
jgi:Ca2+-binding RTX toxin-like protein